MISILYAPRFIPRDFLLVFFQFQSNSLGQDPCRQLRLGSGALEVLLERRYSLCMVR